MLTRAIPSTGELIPLLGLGTWQTFDRAMTPGAASPLEQVLDRLASEGRGVVDTSPMYGRAEHVLGQLMQRRNLQGRLFTATKVWTRGRENGVSQMEQSRGLLGVQTIDLVQVHNLLDADTHLETLTDWRGVGRVRYIGITHYTASAHRDVERVMRKWKPDVIQINLSPLEPEAEQRLLPAASDLGIAVLVNRPFACGELFTRTVGRQLSDSARALGCRTWAQLALKWIVSHPAVTCVIPATCRLDHLLECQEAVREPFLSDGERRTVAEEITG